jgi:hypothetical protein
MNGIALRYVVTDSDEPPSAAAGACVVADGARDGRIEDPIWLVRPVGLAAQDAPYQDAPYGGGSGCAAGAASGLASVVLFLSVLSVLSVRLRGSSGRLR